MRIQPAVAVLVAACSLCSAQTRQSTLSDASFAKYKPLPAPAATKLVLKRGSRLAICGDSITEQKLYSRLMEDYLTMCVPELEVSVRQYGWGGEKASGFLARMTNDCLRFKPTVATTCYGMNDHEYRAYDERIGQTYREKSKAIIEAFKAYDVQVIHGSPGCVGKPSWMKGNDSLEDLNLNLCTLRNIGIELAKAEKVGFADVFWPMFTAGVEARKKYGVEYAIAGGDGIHPGWSGHTIMAYAFLKALGLKGDIGTVTVDLKKGKAKVSAGHEMVLCDADEYQIRSSRYPFCACVERGQSSSYPVCGRDDVSKDSSIRSAMSLIPFNQDLNRLILIARDGKAKSYQVIWGEESKEFTAEQLARGINLAAEFPCNPFCSFFAKVDAAIAAKQAFETQQVKQSFHSPQAKTNMDAVVEQSEKEREPLATAVRAAFVPVTHSIKIIAR